MALTAGAIAAGVLGAGASLIGSGRSAAAVQAQNELTQQNIDLNRQNLTQQMMNQALVNQRAVAGSTDAFGSTSRYDPATNTWVSDLGPLPKAADTAAQQAGITRNTTDLQQQELANRETLKRAALAGPGADTAIRNLSDFRPMQRNDLVGLLTQQSTEAARQIYDPLRNDTLRSVARTGTAAGPVLAQLGLSEAQNLRGSLRDNLISAMTTTDSINQQRRAGLENAAANANTLATPQLGQSGIQGSGNNSALAQLVSQRANSAGYTTAAGAAGPNSAAKNLTDATAGYKPFDPNMGITNTSNALNSLANLAGNKQLDTSLGDAYNWLKGQFGSSSGSYTPGSNPGWDSAVKSWSGNSGF